ncbi:LuxR family transcriptional regulator [Rhodococcus zopfii]|uniref:LuxR family transcriptional regulator n=1 Tax=Rhodococcus zopfii TaxID=43772 RepID=A0ABU3WSV4_9NOCA|nr:LuxR family transcriptional regulator [Rhodococcus zopfii]
MTVSIVEVAGRPPLARRSTPPSGDSRAIEHAVTLLVRLRGDFGLGPEAPIGTRKVSPGLMLALLDEATEAGLGGLAGMDVGRKVALGRLLADIRDARRGLRTAPSEAVVSVADFAGAIRSLRGAESVAALAKGVCADAAAMTGLSRILVSEVNGGIWTVVDTLFERGAAPDVGTLPTMSLTSGSPELRAVELHSAVLELPGRQESPAAATLFSAVPWFGAAGYVVAPIPISTGIIGLVHASHADGRAPSAAESDLLGAFAAGFGTLFERAMLSERLTEQKQLILDRLHQESREAELLSTAEVSFMESQIASGATSSVAPVLPVAGALPGLDELTGREREVFQLMSIGRSNAEIAEELVISVFTVKSHVKKILRKLGALNRSEAIHLYLEATWNSGRCR